MKHFFKNLTKIYGEGVKNRLLLFASNIDGFSKKCWECWHFIRNPLPATGEMNAILKRMGAPSFTVYSMLQMMGYYGQRSFITSDKAQVIASLREQPDEAAKIITCADELLQGKYDLLGSGKIDMRRRRKNNPAHLDWNRDPASGFRFPRIFSQWGWSLPALLNKNNADIKGPWELGRCQHFAVLGQAYWLTNDERYARCFADTIIDFIRYNPVGLGVQWACTMDVGLRLVSWLIGIVFFQGSPSLNYGWWRRFLKALVAHGRFIANNLEFGTLNSELVMGNHYISDLLGLYWLSVCFPALDAGVVWRGIAELGFEREIHVQIVADGGDFENSVPYHGLVTEIFLSAYAMSQHFNAPFSAAYREKLIHALCWIKLLRQPGGRLPQVGDADNGRAHILSGYADWPHQHMDNLLAAGAKVLGLPELASDVNAQHAIEALFWKSGQRLEHDHIAATFGSVLLPQSGLALLRHRQHYLLLINSPVGTKGFGNHKHNDQLAVEWVVGEQPIFVDAGCYLYTRDPAARNYFRGTAMHNTVMIDESEQNQINPEWLFRMDTDGERGFSALQQNDDSVEVSAWHTAYQRLPQPVTHRRSVTLFNHGVILIRDTFESNAPHHYRWQFLLHPAIDHIRIREQNIDLGKDNKFQYQFISDSRLQWQIIDAWYSPSYGTRIPTKALVAECNQLMDIVEFILRPDPINEPVNFSSAQSSVVITLSQ